MGRFEARAATALRPVRFTRHYTRHAEGSVLVEMGETRVLCTASVEEKVPPFLKGKGQGWVTAEYGMLPRATHTRGSREAASGKQSGRTQEIQRLIGRSLRTVTDLDYSEDSSCDTDMNVVMTASGGIVEIQGTAEKEPFTRAQMDRLLELASSGISQLVQFQRKALATS